MQKRKSRAVHLLCLAAFGAMAASGCSSAKGGNVAAVATTATRTAAPTLTATSVSAAVHPCAWHASYGAPSGAAQPPTTVADFRSVQFDQSSMGFYGVALNGAAQTVLGQAGATCSYIVGGDGSTYITVTGSEASLYETYLPGGVEIIAGDLCGVFPELANAVNVQLAGVGSVQTCATGGTSAVKKLPTGLPAPGLDVGITKIAAGSDSSLAQYLPASSHYATWRLYYGNVQLPKSGAGTSLDFKSMACAAAPAQQKLCTASLEYFISGLIAQSGYGKPNLSALYGAISGYISQ